jgi:hypothetical protein
MKLLKDYFQNNKIPSYFQYLNKAWIKNVTKKVSSVQACRIGVKRSLDGTVI